MRYLFHAIFGLVFFHVGFPAIPEPSGKHLTLLFRPSALCTSKFTVPFNPMKFLLTPLLAITLGGGDARGDGQ